MGPSEMSASTNSSSASLYAISVRMALSIASYTPSPVSSSLGSHPNVLALTASSLSRRARRVDNSLHWFVCVNCANDETVRDEFERNSDMATRNNTDTSVE